MHSRLTSFWLILFLSLLLGACGWQLRGKDSQSEVSTGSTLEAQGKVLTNSQGASSQNPVSENTDSKNPDSKNTAPKSGIHSKAVKPESTSTEEESKNGNQTVEKTQGLSLILRERNHGLSAAMNRVAWENKLQFSDSGNKILFIERETLEKRPLTVTETGIAAQYQLILTITFSQQNKNGDVLLPRQQLVSWRSYDFDPKLIVAKAQEEEALIVEMREEVARRIFSLITK